MCQIVVPLVLGFEILLDMQLKILVLPSSAGGQERVQDDTATDETIVFQHR